MLLSEQKFYVAFTFSTILYNNKIAYKTLKNKPSQPSRSLADFRFSHALQYKVIRGTRLDVVDI